MSLPAHEINWKGLDKSPRKLRIGLMLDLGVGQALEKAARDVAVKGRQGVRVRGRRGHRGRRRADARDARRQPGQFLARADVGRSVEARSRRSVTRRCPISPNGRRRGAKLSGVEVIRGFNATMAIRTRRKTVRGPRLRDFAGVAGGEFRRRTRQPAQRSRQAVRAHLLHRAVEHVGNPAASINGGYDDSGFPIGVQIVGRRFDDLGVLGMAKAFEGLRGPQKPWPKPPAK